MCWYHKPVQLDIHHMVLVSCIGMSKYHHSIFDRLELLLAYYYIYMNMLHHRMSVVICKLEL